MEQTIANPYREPLRKEFWEMCVRRDLEAFLARDWSMIAADFVEAGFLGIDAEGSNDPCDWRPSYTSLRDYSEAFAKQALEFSSEKFVDNPRTALYSALSITEPIVKDGCATVVKIFDGSVSLEGGGVHVWAWKSLFHLKLDDGRWKFTGFVGYLPL